MDPDMRERLANMEARIPRNPEARRLHPTYQEVRIMPGIASLPAREGQITFDAEYVAECAAAIRDLPRGRAVTLDEYPVESEGMARTRAQKVAALLKADHGIVAKSHALEAEGVTVPNEKGKDVQAWVGALSLNYAQNGARTASA